MKHALASTLVGALVRTPAAVPAVIHAWIAVKLASSHVVLILVAARVAVLAAILALSPAAVLVVTLVQVPVATLAIAPARTLALRLALRHVQPRVV